MAQLKIAAGDNGEPKEQRRKRKTVSGQKPTPIVPAAGFGREHACMAGGRPSAPFRHFVNNCFKQPFCEQRHRFTIPPRRSYRHCSECCEPQTAQQKTRRTPSLGPCLPRGKSLSNRSGPGPLLDARNVKWHQLVPFFCPPRKVSRRKDRPCGVRKQKRSSQGCRSDR